MNGRYPETGRIDRKVIVHQGNGKNVVCRFFIGSNPDIEHAMSPRIYSEIGSSVSIETLKLQGRAVLLRNDQSHLLLTNGRGLVTLFFSSVPYQTSFRTEGIRTSATVGDTFRLNFWDIDKKQNVTIRIGDVSEIITFSTYATDSTGRVRSIRPQFVSKIADAIVDHTTIDALEG